MQIEGLQSNGPPPPAGPRKVVYGNKKKKPTPGDNDLLSPVTDERTDSVGTLTPTADMQSPAVAHSELPTPPKSGVKDTWDTDGEEEKAEDVVSDWDASSGDDEAKAKTSTNTKGEQDVCPVHNIFKS